MRVSFLKLIKFLLLLLIVPFIIYKSCSHSTNEEDRQVLRVNIKGEPPTLDPRKGGDISSSNLHYILFEGLMRLNPDGSTTPAQAERVKVSSDGKKYTFYLRNSHWSNGDPVTAQDFESSWKNILTPEFPSFSAYLLYPIKNAKEVKKGSISIESLGVYCIDSKTLVVELEEPTPYFLELVSFCVFFPANHKIDAEHSQWAYNYSEHFVSNGPFKLSEWKHNNYLSLEKNPFYWESHRVNLQKIHISMVEDELTVLNMYEKGLLDIAGMPLSPLPTDSFPYLRQRGLLHITPIAGSTICAFNTERLPFSNIHLRLAFSLALDRLSITENVANLGQPPATTMLPPPLSSSNKVLIEGGSIEKALWHLKKGLEETGLSVDDLNQISYSYIAADFSHKVAQAMQQQWKNHLGVTIKLRPSEQKTFLEDLKTRQFDMAHTLIAAQYNDPMSILDRFYSKETPKNYTGWENKNYQYNLESSKRFSKSSSRRASFLTKAEDILAQELPYTPLFHTSFGILVKPYVKGVYFTPIGGLFFNYLQIDPQLKKELSSKNRSS